MRRPLLFSVLVLLLAGPVFAEGLADPQGYTGESGDTIINTTDGTFDFTRRSGGAVTLTCSDDDATCGLNILPGGTANMNLGGGGTGTVIVNATAGLKIKTDATTTQPETATFGAPNHMTADPTVLNHFIGIPLLNVTHIAALPNGASVAKIGTPAVGTCAPVGGPGSEATNATLYITGTSSYEYTWAADVAVNEGWDCDINAYPETVGATSVGFWFRTDRAIAAGDMEVRLDDAGVNEAIVDMPVVTVLNEWQWIEVDVTTECAATCSGTDGIILTATAQGAGTGILDDAVMLMDQLALWDSGAEVAIGDIQVGGLIDFSYAPTAAGSTNARTQAVEWTHYFVNYQTGNDALVIISDLLGEYGTTFEALN